MRLRTIMMIVFCISAIAPLAIFWLWPQSQVLENEMKGARERHLLIANNVSNMLSRYHADLVTTFEFLAVNSSDVKKLKNKQILLKNLYINNVCVANYTTGRVTSSINNSNIKCPNSIAAEDLKWMQETLSGVEDKVVFSGVTQLFSNLNTMVAFYKTNNRLQIGTISTEYFIKIGDSVKFGNNGHAIILDRYGNILSHPNKEWENKRANLSNISIVKNILNGESGVDTFYSPSLQEEMIAGYATVKDVAWSVMVSQPVSELKNKVLTIKNTALAVMAFGLLIAIGLAYFASKILTHPIEQMVVSMRSIGNGELWAHEKMTESSFQPKEFSDARDSIKTMAEKLQENIDTISRHAYLDGVTGLPNRECFRVLAQEEIDKLSLSGNAGALLFLDLDGFKQVNDVYGHRAGDDLLLAFSQRLHEHCGIFMKRYARGVNNALTVLPARLGGDEFVVFLGNISGAETTSEFAEQLFSKVFGKFNLHNGVNLDISGSVGGAIFPSQAGDFDELLRLADIAMYEAKNSGKGRYCLHKDAEDYFDHISVSDKFENV